MPILRSSRPRGIVTGILGLGAGALLVWHGMLPNIGGSASMIETFLPWVGVVILALGVVAVVRLSLFGGLCVAAAAVAWGLAFMPALLPAVRAGTPSLTVASESIHSGNSAAGRIARDLAAREPDVIALQQLDAKSRQAVAGVLRVQYPHSEIVGTVGVWSKYAITDEKGLGSDSALWVNLDTPGAPTRLYAVHLASVRPGDYEQRDTMLSRLATTLGQDKSSRILVVGDFNTATTDREFAPLQDQLTEASDSDLGLGFTWPASFPVARLDHALLRGLTTVSSSVLPDNGSDHRAILVGVR